LTKAYKNYVIIYLLLPNNTYQSQHKGHIMQKHDLFCYDYDSYKFVFLRIFIKESSSASKVLSSQF